MKNDLLSLKDRVEKIRDRLHAQSKLWYWYRNNHRRAIKNPFKSERSMVTESEAFDFILKKIDEIINEKSSKKMLGQIARLNALLLPAIDEAQRVLKIGATIDHCDNLRKKISKGEVWDSLTRCYDESIALYQTGQPPSEIISLSDGTFTLTKTEIASGSGGSKTAYEDYELIDAASAAVRDLSAIKLDGFYTGRLQTTLDAFIEKISDGKDDPVSGTVILERIKFWNQFSKYAPVIESKVSEAVESMEPTDISDVPVELLIVSLRAYNHFFADFPLKLDLVNNRLIPG